jgi:hypothetical protein
VKKIWLQLHVLSAVEKRLKQPAAAFSAEEIRHDVEAATGDRLAAGTEFVIAEILKAVPGIKPVDLGHTRRWSRDHHEPPKSR